VNVSELEQIPLSDELLNVMRKAARKAIDLREPFITPRAILLALLDDPTVGPAITNVVNRDKVLSATVDENFGVVRLIDDFLPEGEQAAMHRYDTLAFKTPDGRSSMWLNRDAYHIFTEGAQRVDERYYPKQLALGLAAEAVRAPGVLAAIRVEPGLLTDAIYKL
jgi:hypothetical protein